MTKWRGTAYSGGRLPATRESHYCVYTTPRAASLTDNHEIIGNDVDMYRSGEEHSRAPSRASVLRSIRSIDVRSTSDLRQPLRSCTVELRPSERNDRRRYVRLLLFSNRRIKPRRIIQIAARRSRSKIVRCAIACAKRHEHLLFDRRASESFINNSDSLRNKSARRRAIVSSYAPLVVITLTSSGQRATSMIIISTRGN